MVRSLFFKLLGAFALVIVVLAAVVAVLANRATTGEFRTFADRGGEVWAQRLALVLSDYYAQNGTWEGVADVLQFPMAVGSANEMAAKAPQTAPSPTASPTPVFTPIPEAASTSVPSTMPLTQDGQLAGSATGDIRSIGAMRHGRMGPGMGMIVPPPSPVPVTGLQAGNPALTGPGADAASAPYMTPPAQPLDDVEPGVASMHGRPLVPGRRTGASTGMGPGMHSWQASSNTNLTDMWAMMGQRVVVADAEGRVVSDSSGQPQEQTLSSQQLAAGEPIEVSGQPAGTVLVTSGDTSPSTPAGEFLAAINRSILIAVMAAAVVAMILGGVLFFQITAPVRTLQTAARAIAAGDLSQRVPVRTHDELGDLAVTFNSMAESLSRAEAQRRQLVADVAHELRTPLSVMQANLEAMQDGLLPLDTEQIASLHEETMLLSRLVADLRLLSLAEAGHLKLERVEAEPTELLRKAAERLYQSAQERGVALSLDASTALPNIWVDVDRISQVIGNLVANSLRYTAAGGAVTVGVESTARSDAPNALDRAPEVVVSVTDTGSGIPHADLPHIFDRFYRADKSRARASGGSGLGLAIVKHIVEAHGGRVWAESPVLTTQQGDSCGTRISFTLPASPGTVATQ